MRLIALLVPCLALASCATSPTSEVSVPYVEATAIHLPAVLVGKWLGQLRLEDGRKRMWLVNYSADGNYTTEIRDFWSFDFIESVEAGRWYVQTDQYSAAMSIVIHSDNDLVGEKYEVMRLDSELMDYKSISDGSIFSVQKVDEEFELPDIPGFDGSICRGGFSVLAVLEFGRFVVMQDESVWEISTGQERMVTYWDPGEKISVCYSMQAEATIFNTDRKTQVGAIRIE